MGKLDNSYDLINIYIYGQEKERERERKRIRFVEREN
jgi:hypothetical protein